MKIPIVVFMSEIKFDLILKNSNILYFSMKSKPIISLFQTMQIRLWIFIVLDYFFLNYFINSRLKVLAKYFNIVVSYYVGICSLFQTFSFETFIAVLKPGLYLWPQQELTGWINIYTFNL